MRHLDLSNTVTTKDLMEIFNIQSEVTLLKWRKNKGLNECGLKIKANERYFVRFYLDCVLKWAKDNNKITPGLKNWKENNKVKKKKVKD